jgi:hypothetical protein
VSLTCADVGVDKVSVLSTRAGTTNPYPNRSYTVTISLLDANNAAIGTPFDVTAMLEGGLTAIGPVVFVF